MAEKQPTQDTRTSFRAWVFLSGTIMFVMLSFHRFGDYAYSGHELDVVSQADNIANPALRILGAPARPLVTVGCLNTNVEWPGACDNLWYAMLPFYTKRVSNGTEPGTTKFLIFLSNPGRADETAASQAARVPNCHVVDRLGRDAFLLEKD